MKTAICPGSFDPLTLGHRDIVLRARAIFDKVIVLVAHNSTKSSFLSLDNRVELASQVFADSDGIVVEGYDGLLIDFVRRSGASVLVKGLRGGQDLDTELPMALMNRHLGLVETLFLPTDPAYAHIASSMVRDVAYHGGQIGDLVPRGVAEAVQAAIVLRRESERN